MASFTAGVTFTDGVANDVTAAKLGALVTSATPTSGLIQDRTTETVVATNDTLLIGDASDSNNLKRMTVANFAGTLPTATITSGTITTLNSTTGTITTGVIPTLTSSTATFGTTTSTAATITSGTITSLASTTGTIATLNSTTGTITTGVIPTLTSTTLITTGTGTAAAPAIVPTGDTNTGIFFPAADTLAATTNGTERLRIDASGNVGINTTSGSAKLDVQTTGDVWTGRFLNSSTSGSPNGVQVVVGQNSTNVVFDVAQGTSYASPTSLLRVLGNGYVLVNKATAVFGTAGALLSSAINEFTVSGGQVININRTTSDGALVVFHQDGTAEGNISVSGTTVSYNGGHLSRFSQLPSGQRDASIKKGTVLSNLDAMCEWRDADGNLLPNEQLNKVKISDVEGDLNTAGVFVNWDNDDQDNPYDLNMAMTGDMIIRIAQGTNVNRGDLLISSGDGTAKPQGDDIIRSKTIAKVTSTNVTCTYEDGSYCVPCVLMAC